MSAAKALKKIPKADKKRIADKIDSLAEDLPNPDTTKMKGNNPFHRIRVGEYRIIYEIQEDVRKRFHEPLQKPQCIGAHLVFQHPVRIVLGGSPESQAKSRRNPIQTVRGEPWLLLSSLSRYGI